MATTDYPDWSVSQVGIDSPRTLLDTVAARASGVWTSATLDVSGYQSVAVIVTGDFVDATLVTLSWGFGGIFRFTQTYTVAEGDLNNKSPQILIRVPVQLTQLQVSITRRNNGSINSPVYVAGSYRRVLSPIIEYTQWGTVESTVGLVGVGDTTYATINNADASGSWHVYPIRSYAGIQQIFIQTATHLTGGSISVTAVDQWGGQTLFGQLFQTDSARVLFDHSFYATNPYHLFISTTSVFAPVMNVNITIVSGAGLEQG